MSDSLKDQLLKVGFKETEKKPARKKAPSKSQKPGRKANGHSKQPPAKNTARNTGKHANASEPAYAKQKPANEPDHEAIAARKKIKAQIKELIENNHVKEYKGEITYSYMLGKRVKQIFVTPEIHTRLAADELVITRLNGSTHVIAPEIVDSILALNPDWAIIRNIAESTGISDEPDGYEDYKIPDDLRW